MTSRLKVSSQHLFFFQDRIDGLVNNAGIMNAPRAFSADGVEIHLVIFRLFQNSHVVQWVFEYRTFNLLNRLNEAC